MRSILTAVIALELAACGGTGENIDQEGCTYLDDGPYVAIVASAAMDATAPAIDAGAQAYRITLPASGPGYLSFDSPDDTEYAVFMNRNVEIAASTPTGTASPPAAMSASSTVCSTIKGRHIIELPVGRFFFALGPDAGGLIDLVLRPYSPD